MSSNIKKMRSQHASCPTLTFLNFTTPNLTDFKIFFDQLLNVTHLLFCPKCNASATDKWGEVIYLQSLCEQEVVHKCSQKKFQRFSKTIEINYLDVDKLDFTHWIRQYNFHTLSCPKHWNKLSQFKNPNIFQGFHDWFANWNQVNLEIVNIMQKWTMKFVLNQIYVILNCFPWLFCCVCHFPPMKYSLL